jgi:Family of unknown function (DUF5763)
VSDITCRCFPPAAELGRLAEAARKGGRVVFVGDGSDDTEIGCEHGTWRLGDVLGSSAGCQGTTKAGEPCQGRAGADGFCAAHKPEA